MNLRFRLLCNFLLFPTLLSAEPLHAVGNIFRPLATPAELVSDLSTLTLVIARWFS